MPDDYAAAWRKADEDYDRRERQRIAEQINTVLSEHQWLGTFECACGAWVTMPTDWGRHLLELVLFDEVEAAP